jgi:hypothetical protein
MLLRTNVRGWAAGLAAVLLLTGAGVARLAGDDKPAAKDEKSAVDPKDVRVGPPPELAALRQAVEDAAKAGENVAEIRKQLESLEKALAGKAWVKPKAVAEPPPPAAAVPPAAFGGRGGLAPGRLPQPPIVIGGAADADFARLQAELLRQQAEMLRGLQQPDLLGGRGMPLDPLLGARGLGGLGDARAARLADARFGVRIEKVHPALADVLNLPEGCGLVVTEVRAGSPADRAGVKANDVIVEFAGQRVSSNADEFIRAVDTAPKDRKLDITVFRKGKKEAIKGVELPEAPRRGAFEPPVPPAAIIRRPAGDAREARARVVPVLEGAAVNVSLRSGDGTFTLTAEQDGVKYHIEGTNAGKVEPTKIVITEGEKKTDVESLQRVPVEYRKQVEKLLGMVRADR